MDENIKIDSNTWRIEDNGVRFFVLEGKDKALVIDSGMQSPDARTIAESITKLPLILINTHTDGDHISGNGSFEEALMHRGDAEGYLQKFPDRKVSLVSEGDIIDLGERKLQVIELPGHTPGSIAILDIGKRVLYGGDPIQDGRIFMFGSHRNFDSYITSLERLLAEYGDKFDTVYASHGSFPVGSEIIPKLISAAKDVVSGKAKGQPTDFRGTPIRVCDFGFAAFLCEPVE